MKNLIETHLNDFEPASPFWVAILREYTPQGNVANFVIGFGPNRKEALNDCARRDLERFKSKPKYDTIF